MATYILSHDIGTTGDKATLFSETGHLVASSFSEYETHYDHARWAEQDPADYWTAFCRSTKELIGKAKCNPGDIGVVSFSGQMMAALPVDSAGNPLRRSIIWADQRSTQEQQELGSRLSPDRVYEITGHRLSSSYSATKIMWIKKNEPDVYKRTAKFIHAKDFLVLQLTGRICSDYSDASGMNLLDLSTMDWSDEVLSAAGISRSLLPDLFESPDIVGKVTSSAASAAGLKEGTPVVIGGGDGACATCGAGVVKKGDSYICLGTSTWMATASHEPFIDPQKRTFTFAHFYKGLYFPCGTMQTGGGSLKWFKDTLADAESAAVRGSAIDVYDILNSKAGSVPPGSDGLVFLPYLMGERSPLWNADARGSFVGLSMVHRKAHMIRSVMEGVAYNMKIIADAFRELGMDFSLFRVIGGGARSRVWLQIFADILERPTATLNYADEATSIGAAIAGGVGIGLFDSIEQADRFIQIVDTIPPVTEHFAVHRRQYPIFRTAYDQLVPVFEMMAGQEGV